MLSGISEALLVLLTIAVFPAFWCLVVFLIAKLGGWQQLAEAYRIEQYPTGRSRRRGGLQTIYLNKSRYKGSVTIDYDEYGLYMQTMILFRIGHPLLYIPWEDVTVHPKMDRGFFFNKFDFTRELTFSQRPNVRIVFSKRLIEHFENFRDVKML
mgnify:CR=1 FL=1